MNFLSDDDEPFEEFNEEDYGSDLDVYDPDEEEEANESKTLTKEGALGKDATVTTAAATATTTTTNSQMTQLARAAAFSNAQDIAATTTLSSSSSSSSLSSVTNKQFDFSLHSLNGSGSGGGSSSISNGYETLTESDIERVMEQNAKRICDIYGISRDNAIILLRRNHWNKDRIIDQLADSPDTLYTSAGFRSKKEEEEEEEEEDSLAKPPPTTQARRECIINKNSSNNNNNTTFTCSICGEDVPMGDTYALGCGHRFCNDCWRSYVGVAMHEGGHLGVVMLHCPGYECEWPVPDSVVEGHLSADDKTKFRAAAVRQFVHEDGHYKWCPGRGCGRITHVERAGRLEPVVCAGCSFVYCFQCNDHDIGDHRPSTCMQVREWNAKAQSESENIKWLTANAKQCPRCHVYIEKNEGCMHMTCRKSAGGCGYEWCWLCRGPWSEHSAKTGGFYACNKYDKSKAKKIDDEASKVKEELDHYMFYFHRYTSHKEAQAKAVEQYRRLPERQREMLATFACFGLAASDLSFLYDAAAVIIECRRTLAYSYVYGYYFAKGDKRRELFEFIQEDLERWTNHLTALFEQKIVAVTDYQKYKEDLTNYSRVAAKYLNNFNSNYMAGSSSSSSSTI